MKCSETQPHPKTYAAFLILAIVTLVGLTPIELPATQIATAAAVDLAGSCITAEACADQSASSALSAAFRIAVILMP